MGRYIPANAPVACEPSGGTWHKAADPATDWLASKTSGWTADSFSAGLEVDFSAVVPAGTKAVRVGCLLATTAGIVMYRKSGDANISNTPIASLEYSHQLFSQIGRYQVVIWLSADYKAQFAVQDVDCDLYISSPVEYMI